MVLVVEKNSDANRYAYENALDKTGIGTYNAGMLVTCCLLILAMYLDMFGFSVALPAAACDLDLTSSQQATLSATPLIGVMFSSYAWGLSADTLGRRATLLAAMTVGAILNVAATVVPTFESLAAFKFLSAGFTASANAAAFVLLGETTPRRLRNQFMFLMASITMFSQCFISVFALPVLSLQFNISIPWLYLNYRPWRLLMLIISLPGIIGVASLLFLHESPKFLLSKGRHKEAIKILESIHGINCGKKEKYLVSSIYLEEEPVDSPGRSLLRHMWHQTAPLFRPPLLLNNIKLYFLLMCAYMTTTGFGMWLPTISNAFFNDTASSRKTFCEVASTAVTSLNTTGPKDCDNVIQPRALYVIIAYSSVAGLINILLTFVVGPLGRRRTTLLVFFISVVCGVSMLFVRKPMLSIGLLCLFLYVCLILGNINSYLVDLNPTHLRGMATCLSVVVARGFGFFSVQLIASLMTEHCSAMVSGYIALVTAGFVVAFFLPSDNKKEYQPNFLPSDDKKEDQPKIAVIETGDTSDLSSRYCS